MENKQEKNSKQCPMTGPGSQDRPSPGATGRFFEIHVKDHLDSQWSEWLEGLEVELLDNGEMILSGPIVDQAALMGVLNKLNRLNLTLISIKEIESKERQEEI